MEYEDACKIYANYKIIVDNVDFDEIKDYLYSNIDEFDSDDMELVDSKVTKTAKIRELLKILIAKKSKNVLKHFCDSLRVSEIKAYATLANCIEITDPSKVKFNNLDSSYAAKIKRLKERCIEQTKILKDDIVPLSEVPDFKELSHDGEFVVNKTITEFSKSVKLRLKKVPSKIEEIACILGEDALFAFSSPSTNNYTSAMRKLVTNISDRNLMEISDLIKSMHILEMVGYSTVEAIAKELYVGCNWGRIIVWFAFWKELAKHLEGNSEEFKIFGCYVGFHLASSCEEWIGANGGWDQILTMARANNPTLLQRFYRYLTGTT